MLEVLRAPVWGWVGMPGHAGDAAFRVIPGWVAFPGWTQGIQDSPAGRGLFNKRNFPQDTWCVSGLKALLREREESCSQQLLMVMIRCGGVACLDVHRHLGNQSWAVTWDGICVGVSVPTNRWDASAAGCWHSGDTLATM